MKSRPVFPNMMAILVWISATHFVGCGYVGPEDDAQDGPNGQGPWAPGQGWVVASDPVLELGGRDVPEEQQLYRVRSAFMLDSGVLWVANGGTWELRSFSLDGVHLGSYGGPGEGPGEFRSLTVARRIRGDSILVLDGSLLRVSIFAPNGEVARTTPISYTVPLENKVLGDFSGSRVLPVGALADGRLYGVPILPTSVRTAGVPRVQRDTLPVVIYSLEGFPVNTLGLFAGDEHFGGGGNSMLLPFGRRLHLAGGNDQIAIGDGASYEIAVLRPDSSPPVLFRKDTETQHLSDGDIEEFKEWYLDRFDEGTQRSVAQELERLPSPAQMPAFSSMLWDREGNLWVKSYGPPHRDDSSSPQEWEVFGAEGNWLGGVLMPPGPQVTAIGLDHVVGIAWDDLDLEYVRVHRLNKR